MASSRTRVFFVSDVHGSDKLFLKFVNAGAIYKANVLVIGGDVTGKAITPIFQKEDGGFTARVMGSLRVARTQSELDDLQKDIRFLGNYSYITTEEEWNALVKDQSKMDRLFDVVIAESISRWCKIAEERLKPQGIRLIVNKGNDDPPIFEDTLRKSNFVEYPNERVTRVDAKHELVSLGYANKTPWDLPGDLPEEVLQEKLDEAVSQVSDIKNAIFNIHVPPHDTHLDIAPLLDKSLTPKLTPGGEPEMAHVGSTAVRRGIERYQPLVGVHGHIHESKGYTKIGRTECFNPGSEYTTGLLKGVVLDFSDKKLESHLFTSG